jgi:hypothetical protein
MPVLPFSRDVAFDPEHVQVMLAAFDATCAKLHLRKSDKMTELVALEIIDLAKAGERDADRLIALVLWEFDGRPLQPN